MQIVNMILVLYEAEWIHDDEYLPEPKSCVKLFGSKSEPNERISQRSDGASNDTSNFPILASGPSAELH
eukprot:5550349-Amphidinium_carterae.1